MPMKTMQITSLNVIPKRFHWFQKVKFVEEDRQQLFPSEVSENTVKSFQILCIQCTNNRLPPL